MLSRKDFLIGSAACAVLPQAVSAADAYAAYSVALLGDTHFDTEPESAYHSHYDESNQYAAIQHAEFKRNGEMWRDRCKRLLRASGNVAKSEPTAFVLQLGDIIQGDCDDVATHKRMLADCIAMLRGAYPKGLPFFTVLGNHDVRGKGARSAYLEFAHAFMSVEAGCKAAYPAFSFRRGPDLWVFCDFEHRDLKPICDLIDADAAARHVFLVTHGPFTAPDDSWSFRWRLGGSKESQASRKRLFETLSRRHAVVLSGHTHSTQFARYENECGGFAEFTCNSVWMKDELATAKPVYASVADYGAINLARLKGDRLADFKAERDWFRAGMKEYVFGNGAGHYRLEVGADDVSMKFYPGDAERPAVRYVLKGK